MLIPSFLHRLVILLLFLHTRTTHASCITHHTFSVLILAQLGGRKGATRREEVKGGDVRIVAAIFNNFGIIDVHGNDGLGGSISL